MKLLINNIKSDRENTLRFVSTIFKNSLITTKCKDSQFTSDYQKLVSKYNNQLRKILYIIQSNRDYRIIEVNTQLNELITYFNGLSNILQLTTSDILIKDMFKALNQFLETKFSDLLKIDIV